MRPDEQINALALALGPLIAFLDNFVSDTIQSKAHNIVLIVGCCDVAQYAANVPRAEGEKVVVDLLTRWRLGMPEVAPETAQGVDVTLYGYLLDRFAELARGGEASAPELAVARVDLLNHFARLQGQANRNP